VNEAPTGFCARLKQRKLVQWAVAYVAFAFALIQGADVVAQQFGWPEGVRRGITLALVLGFFVVLVLAWYHGERGAQRVNGTELLIISLLLAVGGGLLWRYARAPVVSVAGSSMGVAAANSTMSVSHEVGATSASMAASPTASQSILAKSIAVLPFENLSDDKDNVFFSDGLSEEILNSLARIDGLRVIGRTSSFQFKGKDLDSRTIGARLGVANLLEGSVRREGERARVTAQLIRASDGTQLWSQTYDRTVKDSLAVQLDIAEQVAGVLNVVLDDKQRAQMRAAGVKNVDAFIAYQKGWKLYIEAHFKAGIDLIDGLRQANVEFDKAIALDPNFSFAYFAEADLYEHTLMADGRSHAELLEAQRAALYTLGRAAATSPNPQQRDLALAERQLLSDDWHGLADRIETALKQPGCSAPNWMPVFASAFGYGDLIENLGARVNVCDPLNGINYRTRMSVALATGHPQRALDVLAMYWKASELGPTPTASQAIALAMLGRIGEAQATLASMQPSGGGYYIAQLIVGRAAGEDPVKLRASLQKVDRKNSKLQMGDITDAVAAALSGNRAQADRHAAVLDARPAGGLLLALVVTECQCGAPFDLDATPHFKALLAESGLRWPPPQTIKYPARSAGNESHPIFTPAVGKGTARD
jgi:TolB-like protein